MPTPTVADIFDRLIDPSNPTLSADAARAILDLDYPPQDHARVAELAAKSNEGNLTEQERDELESYVFVGDLLSMLKSKARISLDQHPHAA